MKWQDPPEKGSAGGKRGPKDGHPLEVQLAAVKRAEQGESLSDLALEHRVSRERVRQWVEKHSTMDNDTIRQRRADRRASETKARAVKMLRMMHDSGQIEKTTDIPTFLKRYVRDTFTEDEVRELQMTSYGHRKGKKVSKEAILDDIRRVAAMIDGPISGPIFDRHTKTVTSVRVLQLWDGKWIAACEEAGVEYRPAMRDNYTLTWSTEDCIDAVRQFLKHHRHGSFALYCEWAQRNNKPSGGTLRNRLDRRWMEIRHMVLSEEV